MEGRDPHEEGRAATPLELLYDLTFVVAVGVAAENFAELVTAGHWALGLLGFVFGMWSILIAWINFSWFASAFDTDDWIYRLCTMVQMVGVVMVALGILPMFHSLEAHEHFDMRLIVFGYVVMRVGLVAQWLRVARESAEFRSVGRRNALLILLAQVGWVVVAFLPLDLLPIFVLIAILGLVELAIPPVAQGSAAGTPWHRHHIAERYGLFAIIALGEGVVGTVASSRGAIGGVTGNDWSTDAVLVLVAGVGLTFGMWWTYFTIPFGELLHHRPARGYVFGYGHIPIFMAIAGTGAGLHGAGLFLEAQTEARHAAEGAEGAGEAAHELAVSDVGLALTVVIPVALFLIAIQLLIAGIAGRVDKIQLAVHLGTLAILAVAVYVAHSSMPWALMLVMVATFVPVVRFESGGHLHRDRMLESLASE